MANTTHTSTETTIKNLQTLEAKTKLKIYRNLSNFYDEMIYKNFHFEQDPFSKIAEREIWNLS